MVKTTYKGSENPDRMNFVRRSSTSEVDIENRRALMDRPQFSVRSQMYFGFLVPFLLTAAVSAMLVYNFHHMENKIRFLEIFNDYALEVEQARRFEKNFLLYGSNLSDALENVFQAERILTANDVEISAVMSGDWSSAMLPRLRSYGNLLERIGEMRQNDDSLELNSSLAELLRRLRQEGQELVSDARTLMSNEKASLAKTTNRSRQILIYSLVLLLLVMVLNAYLLGSRMLSSINHLGQHAHKIAMGDFRPITPTRSFRDEFTDLALAINTMVEELKDREAVLIQSHKMRAVGTLTAGVAHELNNPLNNITLTAHMLQEDYSNLSDEERREMVGDVVAEAGRATKIISNLLDFARESGSLLEPLHLPKLLRETIDLAGNQVKLMGVKIDFQATDNLPRVHGDSQQLRQVFLNLILNAIDASNKGGKIQLLVVPADEPNYVAVKVIDFGAGIPEHIMSSIFDPFFTTKAKSKGTGLGLSVSQGIVTKHGGRIMVNSQFGEGTTFTVVLPVTTIPAELGKRNRDGE